MTNAGPTTTTVNEGSQDVSFSLQRLFESALSDSSSSEFKTLADEVTKEVR
jgi:hypothetical protein